MADLFPGLPKLTTAADSTSLPFSRDVAKQETSFGSFERVTLENGTDLIVAEFPASNGVKVAYGYAAGMEYERPDERGVSHFLEHIQVDNTRRHNGMQHICEVLAPNGGYANAVTSLTYTRYEVATEKEHSNQICDCLSDIVARHEIPESLVHKQREIILAEYAETFSKFDRAYGNLVLDPWLQPYSPHTIPVLGTPEHISAMTVQRLTDYRREMYQAHRSAVVISGNFPDSLVAEIAALASRQPAMVASQTRPLIRVPDPFEERAMRSRVHLMPTFFAGVCVEITLPGVSRSDPRVYAMREAAKSLTGVTGRLQNAIREKNHLLYGISSYLADHSSYGTFVITFTARNVETLQKVLQHVGEQLNGLSTNPLSDQELQNSRGGLIAWLRNTRTMHAEFANAAVNEALTTGKVILPEDNVKSCIAVTPTDVAELRTSLWIPGKSKIALAGKLDGIDESRVLRMLDESGL